MSDMLRLTGMVSGMDTDAMVAKLVKAERTRIDPYEQNKQTLEWQQETYRDISAMLKGFQSETMDILNYDMDMRNPVNYNTFAASVTLGGESSSMVTAKATANASGASSTITKITSLATQDTWESSVMVSDGILEGTVNMADIETQITAGNDSFELIVDGNSKTINLSGGYGGSLTNLVSEINGQLGSGTLSATENGGDIEFSFSEVGHDVKILGNSDLLAGIGVSYGESSTFNVNDTIGTAFSVGTDQNFTINGVDFTFTPDTTMSSIVSTVNSSEAGVTMSYNSLIDKFEMIANETGAINDIVLSDTSGFFAGSLGLDGISRTNGQDAVLEIDGITTSRSSNTFISNGVEYTLNGTYDGASGAISIGVDKDVDAAVNKVKKFVESYNKIIEKINDVLKDEKDYDYKPLTAAQKEDMSETEIETWEKKAKAGILSGDTILRNVQAQLRNSLIETVDGVGMTMWDAGISTSSDYNDGGKLVINEEKLEKALKDNTSEVIALFTKESSIDYKDISNRTQRASENGFITRIEDVINDAVRTSRIDGRKGAIVEKAGLVGDGSVTTNYIYQQIEDIDDKMTRMLEVLNNQETYYYSMFSKMEAALSRMSAQSSMFSS